MPQGVLDSKNKELKNEKDSKKWGGYYILCGDLCLLYHHEDDRISKQRLKAHRRQYDNMKDYTEYGDYYDEEDEYGNEQPEVDEEL